MSIKSCCLNLWSCVCTPIGKLFKWCFAPCIKACCNTKVEAISATDLKVIGEQSNITSPASNASIAVTGPLSVAPIAPICRSAEIQNLYACHKEDYSTEPSTLSEDSAVDDISSEESRSQRYSVIVRMNGGGQIMLKTMSVPTDLKKLAYKDDQDAISTCSAPTTLRSYHSTTPVNKPDSTVAVSASPILRFSLPSLPSLPPSMDPCSLNVIEHAEADLEKCMVSDPRRVIPN